MFDLIINNSIYNPNQVRNNPHGYINLTTVGDIQPL